MPIYEYRCGGCGQKFETLVRTGDTPACPSCGSTDLEKLISMFAVDSEGSREQSLSGARKRHATRERDRVTAEFEQHHKHDHD
jgi:putative FmdB family regulatory protein